MTVPRPLHGALPERRGHSPLPEQLGAVGGLLPRDPQAHLRQEDQDEAEGEPEQGTPRGATRRHPTSQAPWLGAVNLAALLLAAPAWAQDAPPAPEGAAAPAAPGATPQGAAAAPTGGAPGEAGAAGGASEGGTKNGIVLRFDAVGVDVREQVQVTLKGPAGARDITLKDDGKPPDVGADDDMWSAAVWVEGDEFAVTLNVDGKALGQAGVSWSPTDSRRDLNLRMDGGALVALADLAPDVGVQQDPAGPGGGPGGPGGASAPGAGPGGPGDTFPKTGADATLPIVAGAALVLLGGLAWIWRKAAAPKGLPPGVSVVPEPGLLGPRTPSLSGGLQVWLVEPGLDIAAPLLATLARHHRVLVSAPPQLALGAVPGGPVLRTAEARPGPLAEAADALHQGAGNPLALLVIGQPVDTAALRVLTEGLPPGVGGVVVLTAPTSSPLPLLEVRAEGARLRFSGADGSVLVDAGPDGFLYDSSEAEKQP